MADARTVTVEFPEGMMSSFRDLLANIDKGLSRHKLPPLTVTYSRKEVTVRLPDSDLSRREVRVVAEVEHPVGRLKWEGYTYEGLVDADEGVPVIVAAAGRPPLKDRFDLSLDFICSHCGTRRGRTLKAIFTKDADGSPYYIGRQCAKEYWGIDLMPIIERFDSALREFGEDCEHHRTDKLAEAQHDFPMAVTLSLYFIKREGYVSQRRADDDYRLSSTSSLVRRAMSDFRASNPYPDVVKAENEFYAWVEANKDYIERTRAAIVSYYQDQYEAKDDFGVNLKTAFDLMGASHLGIIAYGVCHWLKTFEKVTEPDGLKNEPWGAVGVRGSATVTVLSSESKQGSQRFPYDPGVYYLVKMVTKEGHRLVWFASKDELEAGKTYEVKMTPKRHGEFKGQVETAVTRVAVVKEVKKARDDGEVAPGR